VCVCVCVCGGGGGGGGGWGGSGHVIRLSPRCITSEPDLVLFQIVDAVSMYSLSPYLALCSGERCLLISDSGLGAALNLSPPSSPRDCSSAPSQATSSPSQSPTTSKFHPALVSLLTDRVVKMGMDVLPLITGMFDVLWLPYHPPPSTQL
jgi:hypothetical protein